MEWNQAVVQDDAGLFHCAGCDWVFVAPDVDGNVPTEYGGYRISYPHGEPYVGDDSYLCDDCWPEDEICGGAGH